MGKTAEVPLLRDMISTRYEHQPRKAAGAAGRPAIVKSASIATKVFSALAVVYCESGRCLEVPHDKSHR